MKKEAEKRNGHLLEIGLLGFVVLLLTGGTFWRNTLWQNEIGLWLDCVKKSPYKSRAQVNLGFAYLESGQYDKALKTTQKAIELDQKNGNAYHNLGIIYQKLGDLNQSTVMIRKALQVDSTLTMAYYSLGAVCFENGQYEDSIRAFQQFLKVFPYFPEGHHLLGVVYAAQKNFKEAIAQFEMEVRINPYHSLAHLNLGQIYWYEFQEKRKALQHLKAALLLDPLLPKRGEIRRLVRSLEGLS